MMIIQPDGEAVKFHTAAQHVAVIGTSIAQVSAAQLAVQSAIPAYAAALMPQIDQLVERAPALRDDLRAALAGAEERARFEKLIQPLREEGPTP